MLIKRNYLFFCFTAPLIGTSWADRSDDKPYRHWQCSKLSFFFIFLRASPLRPNAVHLVAIHVNVDTSCESRYWNPKRWYCIKGWRILPNINRWEFRKVHPNYSHWVSLACCLTHNWTRKLCHGERVLRLFSRLQQSKVHLNFLIIYTITDIVTTSLHTRYLVSQR